MQYPETPEKASKFALAAFKRLKEFGIAANPINFAIWYEYFAGKNHDLRKTIDALEVSDGVQDTSVYTDIFDRYIIAGANNARDREWSDRIDTVTERIVNALTASGSETEEYGTALKTFSGDLKTAESLDQIRGLVGDIIAETESMDTRTRELHQRVSKSTEEITELRRALDESRRDALTDSLTGVANRKCFDQKIFAAVEESQTNGQTLSLIFADIDNFKNFNDTHGHQLGDQVLRLVGRTLHSSLKGKDTAARYGGEEFAIILPDTTSGGATSVAENIRKSIASKQLVRKGSDSNFGAVTISLGVTSYHAGEEVGTFIERADQALYTAKKIGRNRVICDDGQDQIAAIGS